MDLSSALGIYIDVAGLQIGVHKHHGSLDTELQHLKFPKGKIVSKRGCESSSICKLMKSSSIGRSLSKGPISMKRSLSSGGKFLLSKQNRSQDSILPLWIQGGLYIIKLRLHQNKGTELQEESSYLGSLTKNSLFLDKIFEFSNKIIRDM